MKTGINNIIKITAVALGFITIPQSIVVGGEIMGGNGDAGSTIGGCIAGFGLGAFYARVNTLKERAIPIAITYLVGGIIAYHLSTLPIYESTAPVSTSQRSLLNIEKELYTIVPNCYSCNYQVTILSIHF